jgi:hypothetical protein
VSAYYPLPVDDGKRMREFLVMLVNAQAMPFSQVP